MPALTRKRAWLAGLALGCSLLAAAPAGAQTVRFIDTSPEQVGLALAPEAGVPETLWQGGSPERLAELLAALPVEVRSPAQHRLLVKLLRVSAPPPPGDPVTPSLASLRLAALARLGAEDDVLALAERIDPELRQAPYWQARAQVGLLRYNLAGVCGLPAQVENPPATADWQRLAAFCRLLRGDEEAAMVAVMLADEMEGDDPSFTHLFLARQFPDRPAGPSVMPGKPLHLAMIRALNQPISLPPKWAETSAVIASGVARYPAAGLEPRTAAAERAVAANVLPADLLVQLYLATELTTPLGTAYRQMVYARGGPQAPAAAEAFWSAARKAGLYAQLAPYSLAADDAANLAALPPGYAGKALRAALVAGDVAAIGAWQDAFAAPGQAPARTTERDAAYAVLALAGEPVPPPATWWPAWRAAAKPNPAQAQLAAGLLAALGTAVPNANGPTQDRSKAAQAMAAAPLGEAALLALTALAGDDPPSPGLQVQAVETLRHVNPADARAIAVELAVAAGL